MQFPGKWIRIPLLITSPLLAACDSILESSTPTRSRLPTSASSVFVDGREVYNQAALIRDASLEYTHYYR